MSWDANTAAITCPSEIELATWSPCNRFIAITYVDTVTVDILDSVTLQRLQTLEPPAGLFTARRVLTFSPDSRILTYSSGTPSRDVFGYLFVVSWDIQTGGEVGVIKESGSELVHLGTSSIAHSADGKMLGVFGLYVYDCNVSLNVSTISIFDIASGTCVCSHSVGGGLPLQDGIWPQGDSLRFATSVATTITIWEAGFTSHAAPVVVEILPAPDGFDHIERKRVQFLPALRRLALAFEEKVQIWDARNSRYLLCCTDARFLPTMSFSSDGHFFACQTARSEVYLWRESPAGYVLHNILSSTAVYSCLLLSHNGESIVAFGRTIRLWHTKRSTTSTPNVLPRAPQHTDNFFLDFSRDATLAVAAMQKGNTIMVLDLESGVLRSTINVGMEVYGLRVTKNAIAVMGDQKITRWAMPGMDLQSNYPTILLKDALSGRVVNGSISPDFRHAAFTLGPPTKYLYFLSLPLVGHSKPISTTGGVVPWFAPDGRSLWCADERGVSGEWDLANQQGVLKSARVSLEHPPEGYPWASSCGYQVTKDWWIRSPDGKRLLMLPPHWQSDAVRRMWKEKFLALLHCGLPEPVILELPL